MAVMVRPVAPGSWIEVVTGIFNTAVPGTLLVPLCTGNLRTVPVVVPLDAGLPTGAAIRTMVAPCSCVAPTWVVTIVTGAVP